MWLSMVLAKGNYVVIPEIGPEGCREAFVLKMWSPIEGLADTAICVGMGVPFCWDSHRTYCAL